MTLLTRLAALFTIFSLTAGAVQAAIITYSFTPPTESIYVPNIYGDAPSSNPFVERPYLVIDTSLFPTGKTISSLTLEGGWRLAQTVHWSDGSSDTCNFFGPCPNWPTPFRFLLSSIANWGDSSQWTFTFDAEYRLKDFSAWASEWGNDFGYSYTPSESRGASEEPSASGVIW